MQIITIRFKDLDNKIKQRTLSSMSNKYKVNDVFVYEIADLFTIHHIKARVIRVRNL